MGSHILLLHCVHCSGRRRKGLINSGQPLLYFEGFGMSTLDEITKEKQRLGEALARVDAQREKLSSQLSELEATERVLARYTKGGPGRRTSSAKMPSTEGQAAAPAQRRGRQRAATGKPASKRGSATLGDQVLALATGKTQQEIAAACKGARPNHVGVVLARHKRAGRIEERDGKLYATQSTGTEQHAAL
jgi:hypothetical protein